MLSQHEADTLAEARKIVRDLTVTTFAGSRGADTVTAFYHGRVAEAAEHADAALFTVFNTLGTYLGDEKARDVLGAG